MSEKTEVCDPEQHAKYNKTMARVRQTLTPFTAHSTTADSQYKDQYFSVEKKRQARKMTQAELALWRRQVVVMEKGHKCAERKGSIIVKEGLNYT